MAMIRSLSVVIPAYNEEKNTARCLERVSAVLNKSTYDWEIIFVNDGSSDKTGDIAKSYLAKIKNLHVVDNRPNRGYGGSLRSGFDRATKEFIAWVPADNQFDFTQIKLLIDKQHQTGADIVSGIREKGGVDPIHRKINRWGWNLVIRILFGKLVTDIDCGFKLLRREVLSHVKLTSERGAMIDTQLFAGAKARGYKFAEVPLTHLPRKAGSSTGANLQVIVQSFIDLFKFWWQLKKEIWLEKSP